MDIDRHVDGTPLTHATINCQLNTVKFLIENDAGSNVVDNRKGAFSAPAKLGISYYFNCFLTYGLT